MTGALPGVVWDNRVVPVEPLPSRFVFPDPAAADGDVVAVGGDLSPGTVLSAYRLGMFPMNLQDGTLAWWSPEDRAVLPPPRLRISRSLRQSTRRYSTTVDEDFRAIIGGCADAERPGGWITDEFIDTYTQLHDMGWAHSIEVWDSEGDLVGGLYGVSIGGLFAGESMFHRARDASKVALVHLVVILSRVDGSLLDVQWPTPHLESMGAVAIGRDAYLERLELALGRPSPFEISAG